MIDPNSPDGAAFFKLNTSNCAASTEAWTREDDGTAGRQRRLLHHSVSSLGSWMSEEGGGGTLFFPGCYVIKQEEEWGSEGGEERMGFIMDQTAVSTRFWELVLFLFVFFCVL